MNSATQQKLKGKPQRSRSKLPWLSLLMLLTTYAIFGWLIFNYTTLQKAIPLTITITLFITSALTSPLKNSRRLITRWFKTDIGTFIMITLAAFLGVVLLTWFHVFTSTLMLLCAEALARLDLQTCGITESKAFFLLISFAGTGLAIGWLASHYDIVMIKHFLNVLTNLLPHR